MQSKATTPKQYLAELPSDRRAAIAAVRQVILKNLNKGFEEAMAYGMIGYVVPKSIYPAGYHCDPRLPLTFASLASQKNHMAVYLMGCWGNKEEAQRLSAAFAKAGKKLDMGSCCVRFKKLEDISLEAIGESIKGVTVKKFIERYETLLSGAALLKARRLSEKAKQGKAPVARSAAASRTVHAKAPKTARAKALKTSRAKARS